MIHIPKEDKMSQSFNPEKELNFMIARIPRRRIIGQCEHCTEWLGPDQVFCGWCLAKDIKFKGWDEYELLWN